MVNIGTAETGMELRDLHSDSEFRARATKRRNFQQPFDALRRVTQVFAERPQDVLQELVNIAVTSCGADSAGISLEEPDEVGEPTIRWVANSGSFEKHLGGKTLGCFAPAAPVWIVAQGSTAAFDLDDYQLLFSWSDFIAVFLRH
jgi:hypothetical protein